MQRPDEKKRALIITTAAKLFATRPYHKVRLDDIAAEAKVGKGTLYIYFDNKEDLYFSLIYEGFAQLVDRLREQIGDPGEGGNGDVVDDDPARASRHNGAVVAVIPRLTSVQALEQIVAELVRFAFQHPHFFELMRTVGGVKGHAESDWNRKRAEFTALVEGVIRRGVRSGELDDPHPELTALCIPGMVRSVMLFGRKGLDEAEVREQIQRLVKRGIVKSPGDGET